MSIFSIKTLQGPIQGDYMAYCLKKIFLYFTLLVILIYPLQALTYPEEIHPFSSLKTTPLGLQLLEAEDKYKKNPLQTLKQLNNWKASKNWENSPTINAKYYILKILIHRALSSTSEERKAIEELKKYAQEVNVTWLKLEANYQNANFNLIHDGNNKLVKNIIDETLEPAIKINFNHLVGRLYNLRAITKQNNGDNNGALKDYFQALEALERYHTEDWLIKIYSNISIIYLQIEDFSKGLEINDLAFKIYNDEQRENAQLKTSLLIMRSLFLKNLSKNDEAIRALYLAKESASKTGSISLILNVKNNLSGMLLQAKRIKEAKLEVQECIDESIKHGVNSVLHYCRSNLGHIEIELGNYATAIELLTEAKNSFEKQDNFKAMIQQQYSLSNAYELAGEHYSALIEIKSYYKKYIELMFSERAREVTKIHEDYQTRLKDNEIEMLKIQNDLQSVRLQEKELSNTLLILFSFISFFVLYLLVRRYVSIRKYKNKLEKTNTILKNKIQIDPLTKLGNRRALTEYIENFDIESNTDVPEYLLIMIDIDHFKQVNDTFGHSVGDEVLIAVANLLGSQTRENDVLVRWGGEEFILVVENKQKDNVISIVDRIIKTISNQAVNTTLGDLDITISAGATSVKNGNLNSLTWPKILNCIDEALYTAKHNGRNQAVVI